ncbi:MAG TPA: GGDEF and EAL domain-containing protein [Xanthomonadaceae bacterium]|nr:GGDEF and EAL domain-containing protein [Xanthomonadaceae bacterium]
MPSRVTHRRVTDLQHFADSRAELFTRALLRLTREVWHPDCTFETAISAICSTASEALDVERVSVWAYEPTASLLRCIHVHQALGSADMKVDCRDRLSLDGDDYMAALKDVRALDTSDFDATPITAPSHFALRDYLQRHRIHALLDAPAWVEGELLGLISHECIDRSRDWKPEEVTFAGSMGDYVSMAYEIARRRDAEKTVQHMLLHDTSTGLPNLAYTEELLRQRLTIPGARCESLAVVHVRIDAAAGRAPSSDAPTEDQVMADVALRLRELKAPDMTLARVHSNGFAFVLNCRPVRAAAARLAARCLELVREVGDRSPHINPGAAVGIAFAGEAAEHDVPQTILREAEEAADRAGQTDKFAIQVFDQSVHEEVAARFRLESALRSAFQKDEFELHYQPEFDAQDCRWIAAEALLRWRTEGGLLSAHEFIDAAECSGLILPLGTWVLRRACDDAAHWPATHAGVLATVRVNVSARQFEDSAIVDDVATALADSGLPPHRLCLEVTESTIMGDVERACDVLTRINSTGVQVAIDDFGTGYGSLVYLKRLPVDVLKIDRSFVAGLPSNTIDAAIIAALAGLAKAMAIEVVAEGVERVEQQHALQAAGVQRMQGWLYARALDQSSIKHLLASAVPQPFTEASTDIELALTS